MRRSNLSKPVAVLVSMFFVLLHVQPLHAALVGTEQILQEAGAEFDRARLGELVQREEIREQFASLGVDPATIDQRIANLTDAEVAELNHKLTQLPAGGDALGVALVVFIVFVITDVIGATDIFPFIKSVQ